ncbi:uncharacterized protein TRAVEDRAFT_71518 [Trametes versicolor FP-101664 SS1]|uniref:uncharacterized protein n=1 Tax=Trametes versicolor (strain FP-101664) TaxID=717944 RepID=UPI0004622783|nr:uncharacterized protein TRAVEDRAFT_71518 [Trametes versicolor FP-101664 SS1]EIW59460.1 hypothetical protein TRAVEDRAFT_71518 [Trametes versicolor FP-101664 SS1]
MSAPSSPTQAPGEIEIVSSPVSLPTRTVAIIKHHALNHRFDIELRISDAGFEIVKERQMEFDVETDPDTLFELFGPDFESFAEGPVWVYVLERRRAVEVWHSLMGDPDPEVARNDTPNSIRALYGLSAAQNAVMGSTDAQIAEMQIQAIFASSPPFPTTELPDVGHPDYDNVPAGSLRSVSSSVLSALRNGRSDNGYPASSTAGTSAHGLGKPAFKARNLPATHAAPDIVPRMSKAAALRAGISYESPKRAPPTKERLAQTFANVPGHKRSETISVASTAPPVVAPRMTRAASLRLGIKPEEKPRRPVTANSDASANGKDPKHTFDGVPGHKRRESIAVASTRPPAVAPRTNRSAALRQQKDSAPPSSFGFRQPSQTGPSRSSSRQSFSGTSSARPTFSRPPSAASTTAGPAPARLALSRTTSLTSTTRPAPRPSAAFASKTAPTVPRARPTPAPKEEPVAPAKPRPRPSSLQAPTVAPRTNKSALLRAAKMASAALGATPAKKPAPVPRAVRA